MVSAQRKPRRVATEVRLDIRVTVDPHMGAIYTRFLAIPTRLRGRELLALARERLSLAELAGLTSARAGEPVGAVQAGSPTSQVAGLPSPGSLPPEFADFTGATPPMQ